jgi:hypothetical protein
MEFEVSPEIDGDDGHETFHGSFRSSVGASADFESSAHDRGSWWPCCRKFTARPETQQLAPPTPREGPTRKYLPSDWLIGVRSEVQLQDLERFGFRSPQLTPPSQHTQLLLLLHLRHLLPLPPSRSGAPGGDRPRRCGRRYFQMGDKVQVDGEEVGAGLIESAKERPNLPWNPV